MIYDKWIAYNLYLMGYILISKRLKNNVVVTVVDCITFYWQTLMCITLIINILPYKC